MARWSMLEQIAVEAGDAQKSSMDFIDLFYSVCVCVLGSVIMSYE